LRRNVDGSGIWQSVQIEFFNGAIEEVRGVTNLSRNRFVFDEIEAL
jgi:hypothetical protein